jgi:uncharacterized protein YbbC (DUF1343 family)
VQPFYGKFAKKVLRGVQLVLDDPRAFTGRCARRWRC